MELSFPHLFPVPTQLLKPVPACVMKSRRSVFLLPMWEVQFVDCATHQGKMILSGLHQGKMILSVSLIMFSILSKVEAHTA